MQIAQWALAWCLRRREVQSVIPGCKDVKQVEANAKAAEMVEEFISHRWGTDAHRLLGTDRRR